LKKLDHQAFARRGRGGASVHLRGTSAPDMHSILGFGWLRKSVMLGTVLIIILILLLIGALPNWGYSSGWGYYPGGGLGIILIIVIILVLMGRI
jgi:Protein of unknown function (DUF3309)